jgi:hypothetical protein
LTCYLAVIGAATAARLLLARRVLSAAPVPVIGTGIPALLVVGGVLRGATLLHRNGRDYQGNRLTVFTQSLCRRNSGRHGVVGGSDRSRNLRLAWERHLRVDVMHLNAIALVKSSG